jgi:hypothetical protein
MNTCKTCIHWREVTNGARPVRLDDVTVRNCTAQPPKSDYNWPRTMEHHVCGMHEAPPQVAVAMLTLEAQQSLAKEALDAELAELAGLVAAHPAANAAAAEPTLARAVGKPRRVR